MVTLRVFGQAEVRAGDARVSFRSAKALELLAYLATAKSREAPRAEVASVLWPDAELHRQRPNLRQTLQYIKRAEESASISLVQVSKDFLELDADVQMDESGAGPFLSGFEGEWVEARRAEFDKQRVVGLLQEAEECLREDPTRALGQAEQAIGIDPFLEAARILKVSALRRLGEEAKAVKAAEEYAQLVHEELGIEPSSKLLKVAKPATSTGMEERTASMLSPRERVAMVVAQTPARMTMGQLEEAADELELALSNLHGSPAVEHQAQIALARVALEARDLRKATHLMSQLHASRVEDLPSEAFCLYGKTLFLGGNRQQAAAYARKAIAMARKAGEIEPLIEGLLLAVQISWGEDNLSGMLRLSEQAFGLAKKAKARRLTWRALDAKASALFRLNRMQETEDCYREAIEEAKACQSSDMEAWSRGKLGRVLEGEGDFTNALKEYRKSLAILEAGQNRGWLAQTITYLGDLETLMGQAEEGKRYHARGIGLRRMSGESLGLATSLRGLGKALAAQGDYLEAVGTFKESIKVFLQLGDRQSAASVRVPLASTLIKLGSREQAARMLDIAEESLAPLSDAQILTYFNDRTLLADNRRQLRKNV